MSKLSLESLTVETFSTEGVGDLSYAAIAVGPSRRYSQCDSCGIACTYDCPVPSANYTDCGSCGIACTAIEPC
jgi:hypothetical protein